MVGCCYTLARNLSRAYAPEHEVEQGAFGIGNAYHQLPAICGMSSAECDGAFAINEAGDVSGIYNREVIGLLIRRHRQTMRY